MTKQIEVLDNPNYLPVLDHGFVGIVSVMGDDSSVTQAARVSYGAGTKSVREDRGLIRYLMRHSHTSPFELNAIKLHLKAPIFVLRQWFRHRTHSANEYSGRYSIMSDEFYVPKAENIQPQSQDNKQGRAGTISEQSAEGVQWLMQAVHENAYDVYKVLLGDRGDGTQTLPYEPYSENPLLDDDFPGIARELARTVLPVANYSELYWQQSLHNMLGLLKLRTDSHAQYEIRQFADAVYTLIKPYFPASVEAWEDYARDATKLSRMETNLLTSLLAKLPPDTVAAMIDAAGGAKEFAAANDLSKRELDEFLRRFSLA